jgi:hypothetical protein
MDIVEQLRKCANTVYYQDGYTFRLGLQNEAADTIEQLRKALRMWVKFWEEDGDDVWLAEEAMEATYSLLRDDNV